MEIFCCHCQQNVIASQRTGKDIFGSGKAERTLFFVCSCGSFVGIKKGKKVPSGNIPTHEMRKVSNLAQGRIRILTSLRIAKYGECAASVTKRLGFTYRVGGLRTLQQAQLSLVAVNQMISELPQKSLNRVLEAMKALGDNVSDITAKQRIDVFCCGCSRITKATLTNGRQIYGERHQKLVNEPYWQCSCGLYVGCHKNSVGVLNPLGVIPTVELRKARKYIHAKADPMWQLGYIERGVLLKRMAHKLGLDEYHTGELRTIEQARNVFKVVNSIVATLTQRQQQQVINHYNLTIGQEPEAK